MYVLVHVRSTDCELPPLQYFERLTQLATTHTKKEGIDPVNDPNRYKERQLVL